MYDLFIYLVNGIYLWFIFRLLLQPDIKMWIMYDKSRLVEQIEKPAELVNGNLKIQPTAGKKIGEWQIGTYHNRERYRIIDGLLFTGVANNALYFEFSKQSKCLV